MKHIALAAALIAWPLTTHACPNILVGDSLAVGMSPYASQSGFQVVAREGAGVAWLRRQKPLCASSVVLVLGTNDVTGLNPDNAAAYVADVTAIMDRWGAYRVTWATPGCFPRYPNMERGSLALDQALVDATIHSHSGRVFRCHVGSGDGIHATALGYRAWWGNLQDSSESLQRHSSRFALPGIVSHQ